MATKIITVAATPPAVSTGADYNKGAPLNAVEFDQNLVNLRAAVDGKAALAGSASQAFSASVLTVGGILTQIKTASSAVGSLITASPFGDVPTAGELYVSEIGSSKCLIASFYKPNNATVPLVTLQVASGLALGASNSQGTQTVTGYTGDGTSIRMTAIHHKILAS